MTGATKYKSGLSLFLTCLLLMQLIIKHAVHILGRASKCPRNTPMTIPPRKRLEGHITPHKHKHKPINDRIQKMEEHLISTSSTAYGFTQMKDQIKKQFAENNIIAENNGKPNVITQWSTASTILRDIYAHPKQESHEIEKVRILEAA